MKIKKSRFLKIKIVKFVESKIGQIVSLGFLILTKSVMFFITLLPISNLLSIVAELICGSNTTFSRSCNFFAY